MAALCLYLSSSLSSESKYPLAFTLVISYIVIATVALILVSRAAAFIAIPPHPQIPMIPILSESTLSFNERKSTAAMKSSVLISGEAIYLTLPPLSPVNEGSNAIVRKPLSAIVCAYNPLHCSFTAPNGPHTAIAGRMPLLSLGTYMSAASVMPYRFTKVTLLCSTLSLLGNVLSHSVTSLSFSFVIIVFNLRTLIITSHFKACIFII